MHYWVSVNWANTDYLYFWQGVFQRITNDFGKNLPTIWHFTKLAFFRIFRLFLCNIHSTRPNSNKIDDPRMNE